MMFHPCMITDDLDYWEQFPMMMNGLGFKMDCCKSFEAYRKHSKLKLKPAKSKRDSFQGRQAIPSCDVNDCPSGQITKENEKEYTTIAIINGFPAFFRTLPETRRAKTGQRK